MNIPLKYQRRKTTVTYAGSLAIGGDNPIRLQTMANVNTNDTEAGVKQALRCIEAGAELVRFTTQGMREVESLGVIHRQLQDVARRAQQQDQRGEKTAETSESSGQRRGCVPLVADIHFRSDVAEEAARTVEKVRINPGNYANDPTQIRERFVRLLEICKAHKTALRIGVNHGSLSQRMMEKYGDTPEGMVESCMEFLRIATEEKFKDIVLSIKASNTRVMVETVRLLVRTMDAEGMHFPLHLGVTEAGEGEDGRIKSAVGIGALLADGIGDTIRVSLSEEPEAELPVARALRDYFTDPGSVRYNGVKAAAEGTCVSYACAEENTALFALHAAAECGRLLWDYGCTELHLENPCMTETQLRQLEKDILQAARVRMYKTEFTSCPGCGRTMFDLQKTVAEIKQAFSGSTEPDSSPLKIAVMGCIVNGPGEMADADYGYVGAGRGRVSLYRKKECVAKNIPQEEALAQLLRLIKEDRQKEGL